MLDIVIVSKIEHFYTLNLSIPLLQRYISKRGRIIIVSNIKYKKYYNRLNNNIEFFNENNVIKNLDLEIIKKYNIYGFPKRAGWYFQQLLKMGMANIDGISENYIVWDADTIPLRNIEILNKNGKYNFIKSNEYHEPYFANYERLLGERANYEFSFIAQFMIFNKHIMKEIFDRIEKKYNREAPWYYCILKNIKGYHGSLFSEYETYGNYIKNHYPELCNFIELKWLREGTEKIGTPFPRLKDLNKLSKEYYYVSFELKAKYLTSKIKKRIFTKLYPYYKYLINK